MPSTVISARRGLDHFEPEATLNPTEQRLLRGHLEQIDFAAYAANRELISRTLGRTDLGKFKRLAIAAAQARVHWVAEAASMAESGAALSAAQVARLTTCGKPTKNSPRSTKPCAAWSSAATCPTSARNRARAQKDYWPATLARWARFQEA